MVKLLSFFISFSALALVARNGFKDPYNCKTFVESEYLENYPEVLQAIKRGEYVSGFDHYLKVGQGEHRSICKLKLPCKEFVERQYLEANPDVDQAVKKGVYRSGKEHWEKNGKFEKRKLCRD